MYLRREVPASPLFELLAKLPTVNDKLKGNLTKLEYIVEGNLSNSKLRGDRVFDRAKKMILYLLVDHGHIPVVTATQNENGTYYVKGIYPDKHPKIRDVYDFIETNMIHTFGKSEYGEAQDDHHPSRTS
jgi:hypothetical protein